MSVKKVSLWVDQYGNQVFAHTQKELREQFTGKVSPMYCDLKDGRTVKTGVVIGQHWFTQYQRVEREA